MGSAATPSCVFLSCPHCAETSTMRGQAELPSVPRGSARGCLREGTAGEGWIAGSQGLCMPRMNSHCPPLPCPGWSRHPPRNPSRTLLSQEGSLVVWEG